MSPQLLREAEDILSSVPPDAGGTGASLDATQVARAAEAEIDRYRKPVLDSFERMAARMPQISVWDPLPVLCPGSVCEPSMQGRPLYFDGDHLSSIAQGLSLEVSDDDQGRRFR